MCHQHQPVPLDAPIRKREATIRLSLSLPLSMNRQIEEWRLLTGNDKTEILRQIIRQWLDDHPLPVVVGS
ncbi:ribbon-helix-helix domain-containing protein [bacterium]|nr:ribbon-helix-helix domain-containing protein [bacterium]